MDCDKFFPRFAKYSKVLDGDKLITLKKPDEIKPLMGRELHVFEKVDGGNCQIRKAGRWKLLPGSKANFLTGKIVKTFPWFEKFVGWTYSNNSLYNLPEDVVMFGEWSGNHTIYYTLENTDKFFVLDVLKLNERRFMEYEEAKKFLEELGIEDVRFLEIKAKGEITQATLERLLAEPSDFYQGPREGLVLKDYCANPQQFFRLYHQNFSEALFIRAGRMEYLTPIRFIKKAYEMIEQEPDRTIDKNELINAVVYEIKRDYGEQPNKARVRERLHDFLKRGELKDVENYMKGAISQRNGRKKASLSYLSPKGVRFILDNYLQSHSKLSYSALVEKVRNYANDRGDNLTKQEVKSCLDYLLKNKKLRKIANRIIKDK